MAKQYMFGCPEQLKAIIPFCKEDTTHIVNTAKMWSVVVRQGKTTWDGKLGVSFFSQGPERKACVFRHGTNGQRHVLGWLKYNAALKWCEDNLEQTK